jgi:hypothetical protein
MEQAAEMAQKKFQAAHEVAMLEMEQRFEERMKRFESAHEVGMAAAAGRTATMTRGVDRSDEREDGRESSSGESQQPEVEE